MKLLAVVILSGFLFGCLALIRTGIKDKDEELVVTGILVGCACVVFLINAVY